MFGREERGALRLYENFWANSGSFFEEEAESLIDHFSEKETKSALD
jgi:hypothetical protein